MEGMKAGVRDLSIEEKEVVDMMEEEAMREEEEVDIVWGFSIYNFDTKVGGIKHDKARNWLLVVGDVAHVHMYFMVSKETHFSVLENGVGQTLHFKLIKGVVRFSDPDAMEVSVPHTKGAVSALLQVNGSVYKTGVYRADAEKVAQFNFEQFVRDVDRTGGELHNLARQFCSRLA